MDRAWLSAYAVYLNGEPLKTKIHLDDLNQSLRGQTAAADRRRVGPANRFHGRSTRCGSIALRSRRKRSRCWPYPLPRASSLASPRSDAPRRRRQAALVLPGPVRRRRAMQEARKHVLDLRTERAAPWWTAFPTVMVMQESRTPRETHLLIRGAYDRPGDKVIARRSGLAAIAPGGCAEQSAGICQLAGRSAQSADRARGRESLLADVFRNGPGQDGRRFRLAGRMAVESGPARLAGYRIHPLRLGHEGACKRPS